MNQINHSMPGPNQQTFIYPATRSRLPRNLCSSTSLVASRLPERWSGNPVMAVPWFFGFPAVFGLVSVLWCYHFCNLLSFCFQGSKQPTKNYNPRGLIFWAFLAAVSLVQRANGVWLLECFKPLCTLPAVLGHRPPNMFACETFQKPLFR